MVIDFDSIAADGTDEVAVGAAKSETSDLDDDIIDL